MAASIGTAWIQIKPSMKGISADISKELNKATANASDQASANLASIGANLKKAFLVGSAAAVAFAGVAVKSFADYEQLVGGVQKIFDQADQAKILQDAQNAFKDLNQSASQYLTSINQVGAAFASTMGDQKGYDTARKGMKAISDFATGTGRSIDELNQKYQLITRSTSSYQSIADQFSGILPATSKDFLAQAQAADLLDDKYTQLTQVPIAEYQGAVTEMLERGTAAMGLAGNTAAESSKTISGSFLAAKSALSNVFGALGTGDAELVTEAMDNLKSSASDLVNNVLAILPNIFKTLASGLKDVTKEVPVLGTAVAGLVGFIEFVIRNKDVFLPIAIGIGAIATAIWAWNTAVKVLAISQAILNAVLALNPIGIIILAIIGLVAAIVALWNMNEGFRNFVTEAWETIKGAFVSVFNWVKNNWPLLLAILTGPIGLAVYAIIRNFDTILNFVKAMPGRIIGFFSGVGRAIGNVVSGAVKGAVNGVLSLIENTINSFIGLINGAINVINKVPGVSIGKVGNINIPRLAAGGVVTSPTLALIGEGRESEAVIPLSKLDSMLNGDIGNRNTNQEVNIGTIVLGDQGAVREFFKQLNQDTLNVGFGMTPNQGMMS